MAAEVLEKRGRGRSPGTHSKKCGGRDFFLSASLLSVFIVTVYWKQSCACPERTDVFDDIAKDYDNTATQSLYSNWTAGGDINKADFLAMQRLFDIFNELEMFNGHDPVIIGGTNEGQFSEAILKLYPQLLFYGFEIQPDVYERVKDKLSSFPHAKVLNVGMSDKELSDIPIGGAGEVAGLFDPDGQRGWTMSSNKAKTVRLDDWSSKRKISRVLYLLIDTEGHEPKVIRGMNLRDKLNQLRFNLFQFELGGTWAEQDNRHDKDASWTQLVTARHLEKCGYDLFLIGPKKWLYIRAEFFHVDNNPAMLDEGFGPFVQGNLLAMHRSTSKELRKRVLANTQIL